MLWLSCYVGGVYYTGVPLPSRVVTLHGIGVSLPYLVVALHCILVPLPSIVEHIYMQWYDRPAI